MSTFAEMKTNVLANVIDTPTSVVNRAGTVINRAIRKAQTKYDWEVCKATANATTTAARNLLAQPNDFHKWRGMPYTIDFVGGRTRPVVIAPSREQVLRAVNDQTIGRPRWLLAGDPTDVLGARQIEVWPLSDGISDYVDGQYRVVLPYWKYLPTLVNDNDENWLTVNGPEWIEYYATAEAFRLDHDEDRAKYWDNKAAEYWDDFKQIDKLIKLAGVETFVPHLGAFDPMLTN